MEDSWRLQIVSLMAVGFREDSSGDDWVSDLGNGDTIVDL